MKINISVSANSGNTSLAKIQAFIQAAGLEKLLDDDDGTPVKPFLSKNKRTWVLPIGDVDPDEIVSTISKHFNKPFITDEFYIWAVKGKGVIVYTEEEAALKISATSATEAVELAVSVADSDSFTRYKSYEIDKTAKVLIYQCYEHRGRQEAKSILKQMFKRLGLQDWKLELPSGHWGDN